MRRRLFTFFVLYLCIGHSVNAQEMESRRARLKQLQAKLHEIDRRQKTEIDRCDREQLEKGEFETTAEFEKREQQHRDECWTMQLDLWDQQGTDRQEIYRQLNEIIGAEFQIVPHLDIGSYDADNQTFPVSDGDTLLRYINIPRDRAKDFKAAFKTAVPTGKSGLHLSADDEPQEYLISASIIVNGQEFVFDNKTLEIPRAMSLMFGNYDPETKASAWLTDVPNDDDQLVPTTVYARFLKMIDFVSSGIPHKVLITKTPLSEEGWDCHACSMHIGISVFSKPGNYWKLESVYKSATVAGGWGEVAAPALVSIGPNKFALRFSDWDMGQGYETGLMTLFEVGDKNLRRVLYLQDHKNNTQAVSEVGRMLVRDVKVTFRPGANREYYDAVFTITGKKPRKVGGRYVLSPYSETEVHPFTDGQYYRSKSPW